MKCKESNMSKRIYIRLREEDFKAIQKKSAVSTCRKLSEYARNVLLRKPVTINQRNQSLDDFMTEMMRLRNELNAIGNNFNQSVKKLHTLYEIEDIKIWFEMHENNRNTLFEKVEEIKLKINQVSDKWLQ